MIILDTNVISEGLRRRPDEAVKAWLDAQNPETLFLCTPVLAELHYGMELLPPGKRRNDVEAMIALVRDSFAERIFSFDLAAAREYGRLMAMRDREGRAAGTMDGLIASIASVHGAAVATRDIRGFDQMGIDLINPFSV